MDSQLAVFSKIAAKVILNPKRMQTFMELLNSQEGAVQAAMSVVAGVDQLKPVPEEIRPQLAVNAYMLMVDVAQKATGMKPDNKVLADVVRAILAAAGGGGAAPGNSVERSAQPQPQPQSMPQQPVNVMQRMGVAA